MTLCIHNTPPVMCKLCKPPDDRVEVPGSTLKARPAKRMKRSAGRPTRMSSNAKVQDAMLGKGRCWVADGMETDCTDGYSQRAHIVSQQLIRDTFEHGAVSYNYGPWTPLPLDLDTDVAYAGSIRRRGLQEILDDTRNIVPTCPNHNVDGIAMVMALGVVGLPNGFDDFCAEYAFAFNGRFWYRDVSEFGRMVA